MTLELTVRRVPMAKCPHCHNYLELIIAEKLPIHVTSESTTEKGVVYSCPRCETALSTEVDPLATRKPVIDALDKLQEQAIPSKDAKP